MHSGVAEKHWHFNGLHLADYNNQRIKLPFNGKKDVLISIQR
jgi:hypothetical protein